MAKTGNRSKARRSRSGRSGGYFGSVINQALVPLTILGLQQSYKGKRTRKGSTRGGSRRGSTRKRRRTRKH